MVAQPKAEKSGVEIQIEKSCLLAPYRGVIASRVLDEGEVIREGQTVFELLDDRSLEARVGVPVEATATIQTGQEYELIYGDHRINATLRSIRPKKNDLTRTVDAVFELNVESQPTSIGDVIEIQIAQPIDSPGFWLPTDALVESHRGLWACFVVDQQEEEFSSSGDLQGASSLRELELLHQDGSRAFVRGALQPGELVIVSGMHRLVNQQVVQVSEPH